MLKGIPTGYVKPIRVEGPLAYVPLTRGFFAIIDAADADFIGQWNWKAQVTRYTVYALRSDRSEKGPDGPICRNITMHREILRPRAGMFVDHIDGNGLNNSRANLREATHAQNMQNKGPRRQSKSGIKGVMPNRDRWMAQIKENGRTIHLGTFDTVEEAGAAYREASLRIHGDFGRL